MPKMVAVGIVTSAKMSKTRRVEIPRTVKSRKYGKYIRQKTVCHVHDEENESALGDTVEIIESRPISKTKRWVLRRVVSKGNVIDIVALRQSALAAGSQAESE
ncbi:MAG: 30S ribosomal protein S17 [Planctomycetaceae bacterium]|nr:30S ribosomal protein S17 [Planctomycetaceae bacterium]